MKHFFKYGSGYINLDDNDLYLTGSGNWQEARGLQEKGSKTIGANNRRIGRMKGFVCTVYGCIVLALLQMVDNNLISISAIALLGILAYYLLEYFKTDFGVRYRIPLIKISSIEKHEKGLKIIFMNVNGEPDFEIVNNVDPAGIEILISLEVLKHDMITE
jgi:hypothetical protein